MNVRHRGQFKRDYRLMMKRGKNMEILDRVIRTLAIPLELDETFRDHQLQGEYAGYRECHAAPDWLLVYGYEQTNDGEQLLLVRTGTHSDIF